MIHLVIPDQHAHPAHDNRRALWLGELIADLKPDKIINIGDAADMTSLSSYEKGKKAFEGRNYRADIQAHNDFQDKLFHRTLARKKKKPYCIFFEGNHEERITRALNLEPHLDGAVSFNHLNLERYYDDIIRYEGGTPGARTIDGITYAHYAVAGVSGKALSGVHPADALITKKHSSGTVGHSHLAAWATTITGQGNRIHGLVAGCYIDYRMTWAGVVNDLWWSGVVVCRNVEDGDYDVQFVSINALRKAYGHIT